MPLDEIARRAGVGTGTVYRHFPSKDALFEAVVTDRLAQLFATVRSLGAAEEPGDAFLAVFREMVAAALFNRALCEAFDAREMPHSTSLPTTQGAFREALGGILRRAQRAGAVRADLDPADVIALVLACVAAEGAAKADTPGRMTEMMIEVFRPDRMTDGVPGFVTRPAAVPQERYETSDIGVAPVTPPAGRPATCDMCGTAIATAQTGRPARYCSSRCRQRAHRLRTQENASRTP
ncbi:TetR/AcrR family transcriptional regulator [Micromonospora sp. WMMD1128]|uniref:TetR/AcrR family transcriptional regulator n=1 Tax=Micromonospora sp. WMMD1128 TaxID=3015150 RepID=UPI00248B6D2C|nr:TetR/AcrR family transcriptional regulator [Micromonospora sp. WMMD1128]WBB72183.1 TetR/AcrR family transcriptional regulator [Micromonospora sp. WMMD1128]